MLYEIELMTFDSFGNLAAEAEKFFRWFADQGCRVRVETENRLGKQTFFRLSLLKGRYRTTSLYSLTQLTLIFRRQAAEFLVRHILKEWIPYLTERKIQEIAGRIPEEEQAILMEKSLHLFFSEEENGWEGVYSQKSCLWCARIEECLDGLCVSRLDVEGLLRFRFKDMMREIESAVRFAWCCRENDREYEGLIVLLQDMMAEQETGTSTMNLLFYPDGTFCLWDANGERWPQRKNRKSGETMELKGDDLLLSFLLTYSPQQIIWHGGSQEKRMKKILRDIFQERFSVCPGCCLCRSAVEAENYKPEKS